MEQEPMNQEPMLALTKRQSKALEKIAKIMSETRMSITLSDGVPMVKFGTLPILWATPEVTDLDGTPVLCPTSFFGDLLPAVVGEMGVKDIQAEYGDTPMALMSYEVIDRQLNLVGDAYDGSVLEAEVKIVTLHEDIDNTKPVLLRLLSCDRLVVKRNGKVVIDVSDDGTGG